MRDKKDKATLDLPGFEIALPLEAMAEPKRSTGARPRRVALRQEQLELLEQTDASGLPVWRRDEGLDLTGLPVWS